jgi:hypothetical protein
VGVAVNLRGIVEVPEASEYPLRFGHDDWLKNWGNEQYVKTLRHKNGFDGVPVPAKLESDANEIMLNLNNMNNREYRLLALNFAVLP